MRLLSIESPFPEEHCMLRFLEPPGSCRQSLWERLFDGTYDKPFIIDSGLRRFLHFDLDAVQSAMHLDHPDRLSLAYTRKMMAFLLFNHAPMRILLLGLGGGSLAKFCYRRLPGSAVTAVEVNPHVIAFREAFRIPADDDRFRVIRGDGADYVAQLRRSKDVILADACDRVGIAPQLDTLEFYEDVHRCLSPGGVFVTNVCGDTSSRAAHIAKIRAVFGDGFMSLQVRQHGNLILLAFKESRPPVDWEGLETTAKALKRTFGLDFPKYVRRIALDWRLRHWREVFV
ncbi:MAG TPA: fused MFS/spermidine synthase [Steroidobacteraceae bacterium]